VVKIEKLYCSIESAVSILASAGRSKAVLTDPMAGTDGGVYEERREELEGGERKREE